MSKDKEDNNIVNGKGQNEQEDIVTEDEKNLAIADNKGTALTQEKNTIVVDWEEQSDNRTVNEIVDSLTLLDDELMSRCFDENIPATEYILSVILKRNIRVIQVKGQMNLKNPLFEGRNIQIDIEAEEESGERFDTEVQRSNQGAHVRRARFHSSMLDTRMLKAGQDFKELRDSYVIFITEKDYFKEGKPLYVVNRTFGDTGKDFQDGSHIIYVNGAYQGNDDIGRLIHDFRCRQSKDMYNPVLSESVKHYKEGEGRKTMSEAVKKYGEVKEAHGMEIGEARGKIETTIRMGIRHGFDKETIMEDLLSQVENMTREEALEVYNKYLENDKK